MTMPYHPGLPLSAILLPALLASLLAAHPARATMPDIGIASAVVPGARATPPTQGVRLLELGHDLIVNERIETDAEGRAHLVFIDGSALSISGGSDIVLDRFVYDPESKRGELALSAGKGIFRLVGGRISKTTDIMLKTPTATIGVRGGIAIISVTAERIDADFLFGEHLRVISQGVEQMAVRPGSRIVVQGKQPPQPPAMLQPRALLAPMAALEGRPQMASQPGQMAIPSPHAAQTSNQTAGSGPANPGGASPTATASIGGQGGKDGQPAREGPAGPAGPRLQIGDSDAMAGRVGQIGSQQAPGQMAPQPRFTGGPRGPQGALPSRQLLAAGRPDMLRDIKRQGGPGMPPPPAGTP